MSIKIITRDEWGARFGRGHATAGAKTLLIGHHDGVQRLTPQSSLEDEIEVWRMFEEYHSVTNGWDGIAYNFGFMPYSGRIFEGRGFGRTGSHTPGKNSSSIGFCIPCDGDLYEPTPELIESFQNWRTLAVQLGHLSPNHVLKGHQDFNKPDCPGEKLYRKLIMALQNVTAPKVIDIVRAYPTLREGKGGEKVGPTERNLVRLVQRRLYDLDYIIRAHITGYFGPRTKAAVLEFQRDRRLSRDGIVGPQTWKALGV